jgi:hypothetical protein
MEFTNMIEHCSKNDRRCNKMTDQNRIMNDIAKWPSESEKWVSCVGLEPRGSVVQETVVDSIAWLLRGPTRVMNNIYIMIDI